MRWSKPSWKKSVTNHNPADNDGKTPLHLAAQGRHHEVVKAILENVSDKSPADDN
jgi:ankyrin repeat protein